MNLIFDFDGTIADSVDANVEILNRLLTRFGLPPTSKQEIKKGGLKNLVATRKVKKWQMPVIVLQGRREIAKYIPDLSIFDNLDQVLKKLKKENLMGIITSNSKKNVENFLKKNNLAKTFDFIESDIALFEKEKKLGSVIKKYKLYKNETYYIGDETRDVDAAKKAGLISVAVSWGYESKSSLSKAKPKIIFDKPKELLDILRSNS